MRQNRFFQYIMTFQKKNKCRLLFFFPNTNIFMSLAKSSVSSSNLGKQSGMSMASSCNLTDSDILLWFGFKWLPDALI